MAKYTFVRFLRASKYYGPALLQASAPANTEKTKQGLEGPSLQQKRNGGPRAPVLNEFRKT